jgi:glycosyltransferase involved in cell wall biosynthesis
MTDRLRVALLHNYRDDQQPSMRLYADRLGDSLRRLPVNVMRIAPPGVVPDPWRARSSVWAKIDAYVGRFAVYPRLVRRLDADVIHIVDHGQGYLLGNLDARRTLVTCHDVILLALAAGRIGASPIPRVALQLFRISLEFVKSAAAVVADSQQTKRDLITLVGVDPAKITVVHPGLNQAFAPDPQRGAKLRQRMRLGDGLLMLQIGRAFYKNISGVLRVLHQMRKNGVDIRLVRVGRALAGEERAVADRLAVTDHIIELGGGVPDEHIPALYNAVDLLLFPSLYEGFGWPPLEAMASGVPVVSSRAGSLDEVVGDAALTADPEDIDALAWHSAAVLTDPKLNATVVARGVAHAARFNWARTAQEMLNLYEAIAARAA